MNTVALAITTRTGTLFEGLVTKVTCPTTSGYITVLPNHVALVSVVAPGTISCVDDAGATQTFEVTHGVIDIRPQHVVIMIHE